MIRKSLVVFILLLTASIAVADETHTVLTSGGVVYTVDTTTRSQLRLVRRSGEHREVIVVPTTEDPAIETQAQLLWDDATSTLFVLWHRSMDRSDQILVTRMDSEGFWSDPLLVASGSGTKRAGLQVALTKATTDGVHVATLVHAAWWSINANPVAEYALLAFEKGQHVSTVVTDLQTLAGSNGPSDFDTEPVRDVLHPPLAMSRSANGDVDVVFGSTLSTRLTRVVVTPKIRNDARLWRPSKKGGSLTPRAGLMSANGDPVKAILSQGGRIVLYTPDTKFRFVMFQNGQWTPERMIQLDSKLTKEQMIQELQRTVEQLEIADEPVQTVIE